MNCASEQPLCGRSRKSEFRKHLAICEQPVFANALLRLTLSCNLKPDRVAVLANHAPKNFTFSRSMAATEVNKIVIQIRFRSLGLACDFLTEEGVVASFDAKHQNLYSNYSGGYGVSFDARSITVESGRSYATSKVLDKSKTLQIHLPGRDLVLTPRSQTRIFSVGSDILLYNDPVGCYWEPRYLLLPRRRYLELYDDTFSTEHLILLAFLVAYWPEDLRNAFD